MQEVPQNHQDIFSESQKTKSHKKWFIITPIIILVALLAFVLIRNNVRASQINEAFMTSRQTILQRIFINKDQMETDKTASNLEEAKEIVQQNKQYIQNQIDEIKTKGETTFWIENLTTICQEGNIITPQKKFFEGETCNYGVASPQYQGKGYIQSTSNNPLAVILLSGNSVMITLQEYLLLGLEENKYEFEIELEELKELQQEQKIQEIKEKIKELEKNFGPVSAQILDIVVYINKKTLFWVKSIPTTREAIRKRNINLAETIQKFEEFNENLQSPSQEQIQNIQLKQQCIDVFDKLVASDPTLLKATSKIEETCEYLEKYIKQNAIKIHNSLEREDNPFASIENKIYLNGLVKCNTWIDDTEEKCYSNYLDSTFEQFTNKIKT